MKKILFLVFCFACFSAMAQRTGKDYAVFFVVSDFDYWADLPGIDKELREISSELEINYGFQKPDFYLNPKKADILKVLTDLQGRTFGPDDQLLVFFSMHGYYDEAIGALIPKDGFLEDPGYQTWLLHPALEAMLTKVKCQHILLSLDACYSGTFGQKYKDRPGPPAWEADADDCLAKCKRALQHKSRLYLTSGGKERTPTQSQFARKWLEALRLRNPEGLMSFPKLYSVLSEAYPQPMYGDFKDNVVGGDFVFYKKNGCNSIPIKTPTLTKADPNTPHEVTIFYPGEWFATDVKIKVLIDGETVGKGTYKTGVNVKHNLLKGVHKLTLDSGIRKLRRDFEVTDSNLMINIMYDRLNGKLSVASITNTH